MISQILCTNMAFVRSRVVWFALISFKGLVNTARLRNMVCSSYVLLFLVITHSVTTYAKKRQRRYLLFTPDTQFGVFVTVSLPLPEPDNLVSLAWFFEANYYNVANATYFEPLLGDIETISRSREQRDAEKPKLYITRSHFYAFIEAMLDNQGFNGRECLLRTICESASSHFSHNGLLGDLLHLILTPSASLLEEELKDTYYEAEYYGLEGFCERYFKNCPKSPLHEMSMDIDHLI